jgi:hypothetical protein
MSRIVNVSEDNYRIKVQSGGTITLDTGDSNETPIGTIVVIGNLDVKGTTTTVESSNTTIKDNILQLNYGQTGNGISSSLNYESGLDFGRGNYSDAMFVFDESVTHYDPYTSNVALGGTFVMKTANGNLNGLQLTTITSDGTHNIQFDLHNSSTNVLKLVNVDPTVYSQLIFGSDGYPSTPPATTAQDGYLVNKRYVQEYIASGSFTPGMADVDKIHLGTNRAQVYSTSIQFYINSALRTEITSSGVAIDNITLYQNTITNTSTNNLILTANNNLVEINAVLELDDQLSVQSPTSGTTKLYSRSQLTPQLSNYPGKTGIFFANTVNSDELVSKNRALLFSILF